MKSKSLEIAKEVTRSNGWWHFACGNVIFNLSHLAYWCLYSYYLVEILTASRSINLKLWKFCKIQVVPCASVSVRISNFPPSQNLLFFASLTSSLVGRRDVWRANGPWWEHYHALLYSASLAYAYPCFFTTLLFHSAVNSEHLNALHLLCDGYILSLWQCRFLNVSDFV